MKTTERMAETNRDMEALMMISSTEERQREIMQEGGASSDMRRAIVSED